MASSTDTAQLHEQLQRLTDLVTLITGNMLTFQDENTKLRHRVRELEELSAGGKMVRDKRPARFEPFDKHGRVQGSGAAGGSSAAGGASQKGPMRQDALNPGFQLPAALKASQQKALQELHNQTFLTLQYHLDLRRDWTRADGDISDDTLRQLHGGRGKPDFQKFDALRRGLNAYDPEQKQLLKEISDRVYWLDTVHWVKICQADKKLYFEGRVDEKKLGQWSKKFDSKQQDFTDALRRILSDALGNKSAVLGKAGQALNILSNKIKKEDSDSDAHGNDTSCRLLSFKCICGCKSCSKESNERRRAEKVQRAIAQVVNADPSWRQAQGLISDLGLQKLNISRSDFQQWHNIGATISEEFKNTTTRLEGIITYYDTRLRVLYLQRAGKLESVLEGTQLFDAMEAYTKDEDSVSKSKHAWRCYITPQVQQCIYNYDPKLVLLLCPSLVDPALVSPSPSYWVFL